MTRLSTFLKSPTRSKVKLEEGVESGFVYSSSTDDIAYAFAQNQVNNFVQNATHIKLSARRYLSNHEVLKKVYNIVENMEAEYQAVVHEKTKLHLEMSRLEGQSTAQEKELRHRRQEAITRANTPIQISISQQMTLTNQVSSDFGKLRELLDDHLSRFQREEASKLQEKIDTVAAKPAATTAEEKKVLGSGLKRWLESVQGSLKAGTEIAKSATELNKYWDKLKDFSETVLNDPQLGDTIESVKKMIEGAM